MTYIQAGHILPKDYEKWSELVYQWARHCLEKYGKAEVDTWLWEVWNEPNIGYWQGTPEEYHKLYDFRDGGPEAGDSWSSRRRSALHGAGQSTGGCVPPQVSRARRRRQELRDGQNGSPLDYIGFHAKGSPRFVEDNVVMGIERQLNDLAKGFEIVASYPGTERAADHHRRIRSGRLRRLFVARLPAKCLSQRVMYSSYTAAVMPRHLDLAAKYGVN